ncbi:MULTISPECIES: cytoplasmic protein [unclassified Bacillus (in: firmicutes)]|uniref:cytoplasmic protein n=1 Tax=unclassified Bacillus (in: firmicutes) TaxID=185979 RepID=UPI0008EBED96|nr:MULTISPECIES: cytoplasmic protein [unclassified Bacillus (in: firmicutes)]SFJ31163.1 hypothetical protein SAMN04488574_11024 [Bacillus sp. 71mf]SFT02232.1 hypothetical protein SAMN04488145_107112 [Bacillus sp. 103mf]
MKEFLKNPSATEEDYLDLSDQVYDNVFLHKGAEIKGTSGKVWKVIEYIDANGPKQVRNGLQAIAVVPADEYDENKTHYDNIILSFRGTKPAELDGDTTTDLEQLGLGIKYHTKTMTPSNSDTIKPELSSFDSGLKWAKEDIVEKYDPDSLHTTGHSKGAAEAHYVAAELNCYATTYAAPNAYRLLSAEAKRRVDAGVMDPKVVDLAHDNDKIGLLDSFGAPLIGRQYIVKSNGTKHGLMALFGIEGHPTDTFTNMFHANGSPILQLEPDEIIREADQLQAIGDTLLNIAKNIEAFQEKEEAAIAELKSKLKHETGPGGKYHLLSEHDIDEAITEIAKARRNGKDYFYDIDLAEELINCLRKEQKSLIDFGGRVADAAKSLRDEDGRLAEENFHGLGSR